MAPLFVVGAGGIGCAVGYALRAAGAAVVFVEADPAKVEWGRTHGVAVDHLPPRPAEFVPFAEWQPPPIATVFLCTKCYDNAAVLARLSAAGGTANFIPIQNGFDPDLEALDFAWEGIASFVSECVPHQTRTRITRAGKLHIGPRRAGNHAKPQALVMLEAGARALRGVRLVWATDIVPFKYTKLMYNAAIGPLAAAAGLDNGQLLSLGTARRLFFGQLRENYAILRAAGRRLAKIGPFHPDTVQRILRRRVVANAFAWAFYPSLRGSYCSMIGDLPAGRTEVDYYNGHLITLAGKTPCPYNRRLYDLIKRMERDRIPPGRYILDELV